MTRVDGVEVPTLKMPTDPLYLYSWAPIPVQLPPGSALFDTLVFRVDPPESGCTVSHARDAAFDPATPEVVLIAGGVSGTYSLVGVDAMTGAEVLAAEFSVTAEWTGKDGPPRCLVGVPADRADPATFDAPGARQVAIVLLETADAPPTEVGENEILLRFLADEVFDSPTSTRAYFEEVSDRRFTLENAGVIGPVALEKNWAEYGAFQLPAAGYGNNMFNGISGFSQAGIDALNKLNRGQAALGFGPLVDLLTVQSIVFVVRSLPRPSGAAAADRGSTQWPWASGAGLSIGPFQVDDPNGAPVTRDIETVMMPHDWEAVRPGQRFRHTAAHELFHNLGLPDQYTNGFTADVQARDVREWSLMSLEGDYPQPTTPERLALGWVDPSSITVLTTTGHVDTTVTLRAASLGPAAAAGQGAIKIDLGGHRAYWIEYRAERSNRISDQVLPIDSAVIGIDHDSRPGADPPHRVRALLLRKDSDDLTGGVYPAGTRYTEADTAKPESPVDLQIDALNATGNTAIVRVSFGDMKPDLAITPATPESGWKSPDIWVENDLTRRNIIPHDTPWQGHDNWVYARVRNIGQRDARDVKVAFFHQDATIDNTKDGSVLSVPRGQLVPAGDEVIFESTEPWRPRVGTTHGCLVARVAGWSYPELHPVMVETGTGNNRAQSNHWHFHSRTSSPATREFTDVLVRGGRQRARHRVVVTQSSPIARTYLDHEWLDLDPGEERTIRVLTEFMVGDPGVAELVEAQGGLKEAVNRPNEVTVSCVAELGCGGVVRGGAGITVTVGLATEFVAFSLDGPAYVWGHVVQTGTSSGVSGPIAVTVRSPNWPDEPEYVATAEVDQGDFGLSLAHGFTGQLTFRAHFVGGWAMAPCDSDILVVDVG
jgi:hypothetical protein